MSKRGDYMTIGIDIDDTFVQTNKKALELIARDRLASGITYYENINDLSDFIHNYFKEIVQSAELFENAKEVLERLRADGHKIVFISSRAYQAGADTEEDTYEYLEKNDISYDAIYLRTPDKLEICLKENIDIFIDDKEKTLQPLSDRGIRCIKMLSHENKSNQFENVVSWNQIEELLLKRN